MLGDGENQKNLDYYSILASASFQTGRVNTTELLQGSQRGFIYFETHLKEGYSQFL